MSNKIVFLILGLVVVLIMGLGGGLFLMWSKLSTISAQSVSVANAAPGQSQEVVNGLGPIYPLETFIVNLADAGGSRYLRVTMDLELTSSQLEDELKMRLPQVKDSILMILPTKQFVDISSVEGKVALRNEIIAALNEYLTNGKISNIYFKEFVVQ